MAPLLEATNKRRELECLKKLNNRTFVLLVFFLSCINLLKGGGKENKIFHNTPEVKYFLIKGFSRIIRIQNLKLQSYL